MPLSWVGELVEVVANVLFEGVAELVVGGRPGAARSTLTWAGPGGPRGLPEEKQQALADAMLLTLGWDGREAPAERRAFVDELVGAAGGIRYAAVAPMLGKAREKVRAMRNLGAAQTLLAESCAAMTTFDEKVRMLRAVATVAHADPRAGQAQRDVVDLFALSLGIDEARKTKLVLAAQQRVKQYG